MNRTIWKYSIPMKDQFEIRMPSGAIPLTVQVQEGTPQMWVEVDPTQVLRPRHFRMVGTGHQIPNINLNYIGTYQISGGLLVFHVYEEV